MLRNKQDIAWLKIYLQAYIPESNKEREFLLGLLNDFSDFKTRMTRRLKEDRLSLLSEFSRVYDAGQSAGLDWQQVRSKKCELKPVHKQFGVPFVLIRVYIQQAKETYVISNEAFYMGSRGFRAKGTPRWRGRVDLQAR